jgi:hypothetical protein
VERIRYYVRLLDETDKLLDEKVIEGRDCIGFEVSASKYGDNPEAWLCRIFFDIETRLPALIEREMPCPRDETEKDFRPFITIQDHFDYNCELPAETFIPQEPPEGFINAHPDDIQDTQQE